MDNKVIAQAKPTITKIHFETIMKKQLKSAFAYYFFKVKFLKSYFTDLDSVKVLKSPFSVDENEEYHIAGTKNENNLN